MDITKEDVNRITSNVCKAIEKRLFIINSDLLWNIVEETLDREFKYPEYKSH